MFQTAEKPVRRRILYAMKDMGLTPGAKPVKSARVVGGILRHNTTRTAMFPLMMRWCVSRQDFTLRYPADRQHGQLRLARDGDGAAAMRYAEARLTPIAELLLSEINMGTVDFVPNYDVGAFEEPGATCRRGCRWCCSTAHRALPWAW